MISRVMESPRLKRFLDSNKFDQAVVIWFKDVE